MRIVFMGSGELGLPTLRWLVHSEHEIATVVTQPDRPAGRGKHLTPTPVRQFAGEHNLPVLAVENINDPAVITELATLNAKFALVIAFGQFLKDDILSTFPFGCVNLHASLLPKYRGAAPINWAIIEGEERVGVSVFRIDRRMDAGPILSSRWTLRKPDETADELHDRLAAIGVDAVKGAFELLDADQPPAGEPQDDNLATRAPKLNKQMGYIDFTQPAQKIADLISGLWSWPGASADYINNETGKRDRIIIARARKAETTDDQAEPGVVDDRLYVGTGNGFLEILEIKPAGKRQMTWQEFTNGRHAKPGDQFETPK